MKCIICPANAKKNGFDRYKQQRYKCTVCSRTWTDGTKRNYTPQWKVDLIKGLRRSGLGIRHTGSIAEVSTETVRKYSKGIIAICGCGKLTSHSGWCSFRYSQSARRQEILHGDKAKAKESPGLYIIRICPVCNEPIEKALRHKQCILTVTEQQRIAYQPIRAMRTQVREAMNMIKKLEGVIYEQEKEK